jgi:hypothetical protein
MDLLKVKRHVLFITAVFFFCSLSRGDIPREYQIKAVFLFNFAQFTDWPPDVFAEPESPLVIGILGSDPFGTFLDQTVKGEIIKGRKLRVVRFKKVAEIETCHILYIGQSEGNRIERILETLRKKPVLTVADLDTSASKGVIIRFVSEHNRVRFQIDLEAAKEATLVLSSKLLRVAASTSK